MCTRCASASCSYFKNKQKCLVELKFKCNCGGDHLNFLCQKLDTKKGSVSSSPSRALYGNKMDKGKKTNVNVSQSKNFSINMGNKIAPPFCKLVCLRDNEPWEISTLIDTGSQYTFVSQEVLKFADYTFMEDVNLELSGINNSKIYRTIEILLKIVINNEIRPLLCTVLPELESTYELPGLGCIYREFENKNYNVSHPPAKDDLYTVHIILGLNAIDNLNLCSVRFGDEDLYKSTFFSSNVGFIPFGNMIKIKNNLQFLPNNNNIKPKIPYCYEKCKDLCQFDPFEELELDENDFYVNKKSLKVNIANIIDSKGNINLNELEKITEDQYKRNYLTDCIPYSEEEINSSTSKQQAEIVNKIMTKITKNPFTNKYIMPIPWNEKSVHSLGHNFKLAKKILDSGISKLKKDKTNVKLTLYDNIFKDQLEKGILHKIDNIDDFFKSHKKKDLSFLPHMGVFRDKESSPLRIVLLSNLASDGLSHNQCIYSGINLNDNLIKHLLEVRFGLYRTILDIEKAFLNMEVPAEDQLKLLVLWYEDVLGGCQKLIIYKYLRVCFGLPASPMLLMLCLYHGLIYDVEFDNDNIRELKKILFNSAYMDNLSFHAETSQDCIYYYYETLNIFVNMGFNLQQFVTNNKDLNKILINENKIEESVVKSGQASLFGLIWDYNRDHLTLKSKRLDDKAKNKREIVASINACWDLLGLYLPVTVHCKILLKEINNLKLDWDTPLSDEI